MEGHFGNTTFEFNIFRSRDQLVEPDDLGVDDCCHFAGLRGYRRSVSLTAYGCMGRMKEARPSCSWGFMIEH
jgi:hypothetical protein